MVIPLCVVVAVAIVCIIVAISARIAVPGVYRTIEGDAAAALAKASA